MQESPYQPSPASIESQRLQRKRPFFSFLKKLLIVLGVILLLIILLLIWFGYINAKTEKKFAGKARPFIEDFLHAQDPWSYQLAKSQLSKLWLNNSEESSDKKLFMYFNNVGKFQSIESITLMGCSNHSSTQYGTIEYCSYDALVNYESGPAIVAMSLIWEATELKIMRLKVKSEAFFK